MPSYEAMVIVDGRLEEGDIQKAVDGFLGLIADAGGEVANVDRWGMRKFSYEIDHQDQGYYFVTTFQVPEGAVAGLKRAVRISDELVRGQIVRPG